MLRTTKIRPLFQGLSKVASSRATSSLTTNSPIVRSRALSLHNKRPQIATSALTQRATPLLRYATDVGKAKYDKIDRQKEKEFGANKLDSDPEAVTEESSVRHVFEGTQRPPEGEHEMLSGVKADLQTVKEAFALDAVPREAYYLGLAGTLPYLATSLSTVYLTYGINNAPVTGSFLFFSSQTAHELLAYLEPIQIGYGAVIISFLGAIHWGLEYAGFGGHQSYRRYAIGVVAPALAWPTLLMPLDYALISQFLAFTFLYFTDARAAIRGWAPPWYGTYRFVLTFIVGASIVISLVGRGQIQGNKLPGPADRMQKLRDSQRESLEEEQREKLKNSAAAMKAEAAAEEENDNDEGKEKEKKVDGKEAKSDNNKGKGKD